MKRKVLQRALAGATVLAIWGASPAAFAAEATSTPPATPAPVPSVPAVSPAPDDMLVQTEEYKRLKAELRYPEGDPTGRREVNIAGIQVSDLQLARAVRDRPLIGRLENQQFWARLWQGVTAGVTIPTGAYLLLLASQRMNAAHTTKSNSDILTFLFGFLGSAAAVYGFVNLVPLFNDLAGLANPSLLSTGEVTDLVRRYNEYVKDQLRSGRDRVPLLPGGASLVNWTWQF